MTTKFSFAAQIQPRTGDRLTEHVDGVTIDALEWTTLDRRRYPRADRQISAEFTLVIDRETHLVYEVPREELR